MVTATVPEFIREKMENQKKAIAQLHVAIQRQNAELERERIISRSLVVENARLQKLVAAAQSVGL